MKVMRVLIFISLILATLQESSPEVTPLEILTACVFGVIFFLGLGQVLIFHKGIPKPLFYLLGFLGCAGINVVVGLANGVDLLWWFRRFFPVATLPFAALASMAAFRSQKQLCTAFVTLVLIGVMCVLSSLFQLSSVDFAMITNLQDLREYGGGYYSAFGLCLVVPFLFGYLRPNRLIWFLVMCTSLLFFMGLIFTFTRTYWISTTISLLFMVHILVKLRRIKISVFLIWIVVPVFLGLAFLFWVASSNVCEFVVSRVASIPRAFSDLSFVDRVMELRGLWNSAIQNPISLLGGNGLGAKFTFYSPNPWSWGGVGWIANDYSHNYYAYLFWTMGVIGLSLFLFFWGSLLRQVMKTLLCSSNVTANLVYQLIGISTAAINLLITSLTVPALMNFKWAFYFGVLIGVALNLISHAVAELPKDKCVTE
ncbi:O-antigen ligase family protein [Atrimonas thermophila]|uniref:O-antigen ligase family protein n=1 Tax=Atrimonas thermophila TaxID=3064161 RepID=UPI00399C6C7E